MEIVIIVFLVIVIFILIGGFFLLLRRKPESSTESMVMLQQQLNNLNTVIDTKLSESNKVMQTQFGQSARIIQDVTKQLTRLDETNKQVVGFSEQLSNLEKVLKSQKQRGNLGEAGLKLVLENMLPPDAFKLQYQFDGGDIVDAVIFTKDGMVPVDAKFSLENYNRIIEEADEDKKIQYEREFKNDLKKRIDETSKYVKPGEGTLDFAFMFIPAEAIYYDLLVNEVGAVKVNTRSLIEYAFKDKKVIIVSPTTFSAYLKTVLYGLQALKIEKEARLIQDRVEKLGKHLQFYEVYHQKLGSSLTTTVNHFNKSHKELGKVDKDVMNITGNEELLSLESGEIEKPSTQD